MRSRRHSEGARSLDHKDRLLLPRSFCITVSVNSCGCSRVRVCVPIEQVASLRDPSKFDSNTNRERSTNTRRSTRRDPDRESTECESQSAMRRMNHDNQESCDQNRTKNDDLSSSGTTRPHIFFAVPAPWRRSRGRSGEVVAAARQFASRLHMGCSGLSRSFASCFERRETSPRTTTLAASTAPRTEWCSAFRWRSRTRQGTGRSARCRCATSRHLPPPSRAPRARAST